MLVCFTVPKALENLDFPFKILGVSYISDYVQDNNKNSVKLVIQYYPNKENYDEDKFFSKWNKVYKGSVAIHFFLIFLLILGY